jgi:hypothetical protein
MGESVSPTQEALLALALVLPAYSVMLLLSGPWCDSRRATECLLLADRRNHTAVASQSANMIFLRV